MGTFEAAKELTIALMNGYLPNAQVQGKKEPAEWVVQSFKIIYQGVQEVADEINKKVLEEREKN